MIEMKQEISRFYGVIFILILVLRSVVTKDPVSDFDLAWTIHSLGDIDRNNVLDASEIAKFYEREIQFPPQLAEFVAKSLIDRGDLNSDNNLDITETILAMERVRH